MHLSASFLKVATVAHTTNLAPNYPTEPSKSMICAWCSKEFKPTRWWQKFCCGECRTFHFQRERVDLIKELQAENRRLKGIK